MPKIIIKPAHSSPLAFEDGKIAGRFMVVDQPTGNSLQFSEDGKDLIITPLGDREGGFACLVRAEDKNHLPRAIKLVRVFEQIPQQRTELPLVEAKLTNAKPFKNVVAVMEADLLTDGFGQKLHYYVSHFIEGPTLDAFMQQLVPLRKEILGRELLKDKLRDQILRLINDIVGALVELDRAKVVHMDLKPNNILIYPKPNTPTGPHGTAAIQQTAAHLLSTDCEAFVVDLGAGKPVAGGPLAPTGPTILFYTEGWFPMRLLGDLGYYTVPIPGDSIGRKLSYILHEKLREHWKKIDIYSCGLIFGRMLLNEYEFCKNPLPKDFQPEKEDELKKVDFWRQIFADDYDVIAGLVKKMLAPVDADQHDDPTQELRTAAEVKRAFEAIPLASASGILTSDTLTDSRPGIRIRAGTPLVRISVPFDEIVNHRAFQRLRKLQQLAFVSEIFPDATHTRFTHSLHAFHLAKQFVFSLNRRSSFRLIFGREDVELLLASALLHDIGQYPFSHTIEDLRKMADLAKTPADQDLLLKNIKHDQECAEFILNGEPKDHKLLKGAAPLKELLDEHGLRVADIIYIIAKSDKDEKRGRMLNIARDLVSGVIDIDRISYLTLDSQRTGVPYGRAVDVGSLLEALTIKTQSEAGIAIEEAGVSAAESVLAAVYWMYRNVYWRHTNRAFMACVKFVMHQLLTNEKPEKRITFDEYWKETFGKTDWEALNFLRTAFDERVMILGNYRNPLADLAELRRLSYRRVFSLRFGTVREQQLYDKIVINFSTDKEKQLIECLTENLSRKTKVLRGDILVDVPLKRRLHGLISGTPQKLEATTSEVGIQKAKVWVSLRSPLTKKVAPESDWPELRSYSPLVGSLQEVEDHSGRKVRIFFSNELLKHLGADASRVEDNMMEWVEEATKDWQKP